MAPINGHALGHRPNITSVIISSSDNNKKFKDILRPFLGHSEKVVQSFQLTQSVDVSSIATTLYISKTTTAAPWQAIEPVECVNE